MTVTCKRSRCGVSRPGTQVMQVGPQQIICKHLLPDPRRELMHQRRRMLADTLQHIHELIVRVDVVQPTGRQQTLHNADVLGAKLCPAEQPVLLTHRDGP